jgi:hypothetical protein
MEFAVLVYENAADFAARNDPQQAPAYMGAYFAYTQALQAAGVMSGGAGLLPPTTATTVRLRGEQRLVQDGPFADAKEQLGGFFLLDVPDLDTALVWAARCPAAARAGVEVRPLLPPPPQPAA